MALFKEKSRQILANIMQKFSHFYYSIGKKHNSFQLPKFLCQKTGHNIWDAWEINFHYLIWWKSDFKHHFMETKKFYTFLTLN